MTPAVRQGHDALPRPDPSRAASLRDAILAGRLAPALKLPSTRALASTLGVSRTTTQLAYDLLPAEGYLTARVGSGTFDALDASDLPATSARLPISLAPGARSYPGRRAAAPSSKGLSTAVKLAI